MVTLAFCGFSLTAPVWIPVSAVCGLLRRRSFAVLRLMTFGWIYSGMELAGVLRVVLVMVIHRGNPTRISNDAYRIQSWWSQTLYRAMCLTLGMRFTVAGDACL